VGLLDLPNQVIEALNVLDLHQLNGLRFVVQIDGDGFIGKETVAGFRAVDNLVSDLEVQKLAEGGSGQVHTFPRRERQPSITLTRPVTFSRSLWNWFLAGRHWKKGQPSYIRTMSIYLLDSVHLPLTGEVTYEAWRWDFSRCWISTWRGPRMDATNDAIAVEEVIIQHGGVVEAKGVLSGIAGEILSIFQ